MCGYFCIGFIGFMLPGEKLIDFTNLFSPHAFKKNDQIILSYFRDAWNACVSLTLIFSITARIIKKLLSTTIKEKKKHDQILMLVKSKYNSIETLISQALNDIDISHKEVITILKEKDRYERMKENVKDKNEGKKQGIIKLSSIN